MKCTNLNTWEIRVGNSQITKNLPVSSYNAGQVYVLFDSLGGHLETGISGSFGHAYLTYSGYNSTNQVCNYIKKKLIIYQIRPWLGTVPNF